MFLKRVLLHAAIGIEEWLGRPTTLPWRLLVPHGYLHVMLCVVLGFLVWREAPERRIYHLATIALLLWTVFGAAGTLFFAVLYTCLEAYASAGCPFPVPSWLQQDWQTPIKQEAMRVLQILERYMRKAHQGIVVALGLA